MPHPTDPLNLQYLRRWVHENRPEVIQQLHDGLHKADLGSPIFRTMLTWAMFGFAAGRLFQHENPDKTDFAGGGDYITEDILRARQAPAAGDAGSSKPC